MTAQLQPLETAVMDLLLAGEHPVLVALRRQLAAATVASRSLTGVGFFVDFALAADVEVVVPRTLHIGDVGATVAGLQHGAGFVLFVHDGRLVMLEGFTYGELWPDEITEHSVHYDDPSRAALVAQLG